MVLTFSEDRVGVTSGAVWVLDSTTRNVFHQLAVNLWFWVPTGGIASDLCVTGQVEDGREQAWTTEPELLGAVRRDGPQRIM